MKKSIENGSGDGYLKDEKLPFLLKFNTRRDELSNEGVFSNDNCLLSMLPESVVDRVCSYTTHIEIRNYTPKGLKTLNEDEFELTLLKAILVIIQITKTDGVQIPTTPFLVEEWKYLPDWLQTEIVRTLFWKDVAELKPRDDNNNPIDTSDLKSDISVNQDEFGTSYTNFNGDIAIQKPKTIFNFNAYHVGSWTWDPDGFYELMNQSNPKFYFTFTKLPFI